MLGFRIKRRGGFVKSEDEWAVAHEPSCQGELLPLAEADLYAVRPRRSQLGLQTASQLRNDIVCPSSIDCRPHGRLIVQAREIADADRVLGAVLEAEEI